MAKDDMIGPVRISATEAKRVGEILEATGETASDWIRRMINEEYVTMKPKQKTFSDFEAALAHAEKTGLPLWDTHTLPHRYVVGHTTVDQETDFEDELAEWEEIQ